MYQRQKILKRQQDIQRILEDFKGVSNIPGIKSAKKRVLITKIENEKVKSSRLEKGLLMSLVKSTKNKNDDNEQEEPEQEIGERMKMRAASMCITTTPMR